MSPFFVAYALFPDWYLRGRSLLRTLTLGNWALFGCFVAGALVAGRTAWQLGLVWGLSPLAAAVVVRWTGALDGIRLRRGLRPRCWPPHLRVAWRFAGVSVLANVTTPLVLIGLGVLEADGVVGSLALGLRVAAVVAGALWLLVLNLLPAFMRDSPGRAARRALSALALGGFVWAVAAAATVLLGEWALGADYGSTLGWIVAGQLVLVPLSAKLVGEGAMIARYRDGARVAVAAVPPLLAGLGFGVGVLTSSGAPLVAGLLVGESTAAVLAFLAVRSAVPAPMPGGAGEELRAAPA
jgi:hypothetical protein